MKITYEWLKEYVDVKLTPQEFAELLTRLGFESSVAGKAGDSHVIDVEVTSNRPDCLCVLGLAREVAAFTGSGLRVPESKPAEEEDRIEKKVSVEIGTELCSRYCARLVEGVKVGPSPGWLMEKLEAVGLRPVNNIVDVTNYVLMEFGQPLHAFDYDCLNGREIIVRCAGKGEKLITLDEVERKLEPWMMVIADAKVPVALAGIMGGLDTEVTDKTTTVLLESACFNSSSIRRTAKHLQVETEASYRFQRKADIQGTANAVDRAARLMCEIAGGKAAGGIIGYYPEKCGEKKVVLRLSRLNKILGISFSSDYVGSQLGRLGFDWNENGGKFEVSIPGFRRDVEREIDLIEEIARHYGYDKIPETIPAGRIPVWSEDRPAEVLKNIQKVLTASGLSEIINHGLINEKLADVFAPGGTLGKVRNPLSEEQSVMRPSLLPGILRTIGTNINRGVENVRVYEVGNVFRSGGGRFPVEQMFVGAGITGFHDGDWRRKKEKVDFYDAKGVLENLLGALGISGWTLAPYNGRLFTPGESALVKVKGCLSGMIGKVEDSVIEMFGIEKDIYVFEMNFDVLMSYVKTDRKYKALPRYPASFRDIAIIVPERVNSGDMVSAVIDEGKSVVEKVEIFDMYRGKQVPDGCKSMAYAITYRADDRTLTDNEVDEFHNKISQRLVSEFGGRLR